MHEGGINFKKQTALPFVQLWNIERPCFKYDKVPKLWCFPSVSAYYENIHIQSIIHIPAGKHCGE